ncbi:TPA: LOW QUALITY PROTEIN: hypothetical protein N0F65_012680 [Lagenidium giganteum]|uniref:Uncharacterized protein n=1 Tax=Lagenidium giganteum TaxID=4803 RepID=A0AAV2YJE8_9STRA|nr:TPA: LOW QUALITY PROTEIN: hypothetical protein N0F65_012680 [Lagenidium giganteum]
MATQPQHQVQEEHGHESDTDDPSSIADVFNDMLSINQDMITAAASCQADEDIDGTMAYQRLLHRNLMEMAAFVDSMFGVYGNDGEVSDDISDCTAAGWFDACVDANDLAANALLKALTSPDGDAQVDSGPNAPKSVLLETLKAEEKLRVKRRSKKIWNETRMLVREQECVGAIMKEAAEKLASVASEVSGAPDSGRSRTKSSAPTRTKKTPRVRTPKEKTLPAPSVPAAPTSRAASTTPSAVPTPRHLSPMKEITPVAAPTPLAMRAPTTLVPNLTGANPPIAMPFAPTLAPMNHTLPPPPVPMAKVPLPPADSCLNMLFPMHAPMFAPLFTPTVCRDCVNSNKSVNECRVVLRHVAPPVMVAPPILPSMPWMPPRPTPSAPIPSGRAVAPAKAPPATKFKRMCEDCRKNHSSLRQCRIALQHTGPEWVSTQPKTRRKKANKADSAATDKSSTRGAQDQSQTGAD